MADPTPAARPAATGKQLTPMQQQFNSVRDLLTKQKAQIEMALPKHLTPDRLIRVALTAINQTPKLLECDQHTLFSAIMQSAQLGLEPGGVLGHAYLVPFRNGRANRMEVQFIPGYKGLIDLARRSGHVRSISARIVYANDTFDFAYGTDEKLTHEPNLDDPGEPVCAYAYCAFKDGGYAFEVMSRKQIYAIRDSSQGYKAAKERSPWTTHELEMWRKTTIRRLVKYLPLSAELQRAVALDEQHDAGIAQDLNIIDVSPSGPLPDFNPNPEGDGNGNGDPKDAAAKTDAKTAELKERGGAPKPANAPKQPEAAGGSKPPANGDPKCFGCAEGAEGVHEPECPVAIAAYGGGNQGSMFEGE